MRAVSRSLLSLLLSHLSAVSFYYIADADQLFFYYVHTSTPKQEQQEGPKSCTNTQEDTPPFNVRVPKTRRG